MVSIPTGPKVVAADTVDGPGEALQLANIFHTTLDLDKLFELFNQEAQARVKYNSFRYDNPELSYEYDAGDAQTKHYSYRLLIGGCNLGEVSFGYRGKPNAEHTRDLEYLLSCLLAPLRNALMYRQALNSALKDPLTGVNNRSSLESTLEREVCLAHRHETPLALIVLDIDYFKSINDTYGHLVGDCVIRDIAACAADCIRGTDILYRYGGEEFVIILSNTQRDGARLLAERIRRSIQKHSYIYGDHTVQATVSLGVACLQGGENGKSLFQRADECLYQAKQEGRNKTILNA